jgi:hypothetical protein
MSLPSVGLNSSTMSRFELKPPVVITTVLLFTDTGSPVLVLRPSMPVTRPLARDSPVISVSVTISPPFWRKPSIKCVIRPRPLRSLRVQRTTELPSCSFRSDHVAPRLSAQ